jgi:hypothetical protein
MKFSREILVRTAREYYPAGFPAEQDGQGGGLLPFQRTPEHEKWRAAWEGALRWPEWDALQEPFQRSFPGRPLGEATQPWMSACRRRVVYFEEPLPGGRMSTLCLVGAASILLPVYLVYMTVEIAEPGGHVSPPRLLLEPAGEMRPHARKVADILERGLGHEPFPVELMDTPLEDLRIGFLALEKPTLLHAFFSNDLTNLP